MSFDDLFDSLPARGWLTKPEAALLYSVAKLTSGPILEVGCYCGRSTCLLASLGRPVYAVDPFEQLDGVPITEDVRSEFLANLVDRGIPVADGLLILQLHFSEPNCGVTYFQQSVEDWQPRPATMAYLDGDHTYEGTYQQILAARRCGVTTICLHDYVVESGNGVVRAAADHNLVVTTTSGRMAHCRWRARHEDQLSDSRRPVRILPRPDTADVGRRNRRRRQPRR